MIDHQVRVRPVIDAGLRLVSGPQEVLDDPGCAHLAHHLEGALDLPRLDLVGQPGVHAHLRVDGHDLLLADRTRPSGRPAVAASSQDQQALARTQRAAVCRAWSLGRSARSCASTTNAIRISTSIALTTFAKLLLVPLARIGYNVARESSKPGGVREPSILDRCLHHSARPRGIHLDVDSRGLVLRIAHRGMRNSRRKCAKSRRRVQGAFRQVNQLTHQGADKIAAPVIKASATEAQLRAMGRRTASLVSRREVRS